VKRLLGAGCVLLSCCASSLAESVRDSAAADLRCPRDEIRVSDEGDGHYLAEGCHDHARYGFHAPGACTRASCPLAKH
jgi:hypothetical protein